MTRIYLNCRFLTQEVSGVQRYASEIALGLRRTGSDTCFLSPKKIRQSGWAVDLGAKSVGAFSGHLWEQIDLPLYLRNRNKALLVNLANTAPVTWHRQVVTLHDLAVLAHPEWFSWRFSTYYRSLIPRIARHAMHVVVISEFTRREVTERLGVPPSQVTVIPPAVSDRLSSPECIKTPPVTGDFVLAVASFDPRKNLNAVIRAFSAVGEPGLRLVLVGGHHRSFSTVHLSIPAEAAGKIIHLGRVSDAELAWLYRHARLLIFPSLYEGFGLPPLEAAKAGCPSVVSRVASLPEVMGNAALYCDPYDVSDIAAQVKRLLVDSTLRSELIALGKVRARVFAWEKSVKQMQGLLEQLTAA